MAYKEASVQGTSSVTTYATLYSTASDKQAVISSLIICNTSSSNATYRIAVMSTAGTPSAADWRVYDSTIAGNDTVALTLGLAMQGNRFIRVSSSTNAVTFAAEIAEF